MKVLVAVDKNPETFIGLRYACHLLGHNGDSVSALHVRPDYQEVAAGSYAPFATRDSVEGEIEAANQEVEHLFEDACATCASEGLSLQLEIAAGDPADEILSTAQHDRYDMIVLGSQEKSYLRGFLLGTVHAKILHYAQQPVLIVRQFRDLNNVLMVYRGSATDDAALNFMGKLLSDKKVGITLLHVQETSQSESDEFARASLQKGAQILRKFDLDPITKMARGEFVEEILKDVAVHRYDLVVLGAYGHKLPRHLKLISDEALNLARLTTRPILVYREKDSE